METANESVYLGREGTGAAQILGSPINVWGQVFAQQRQKTNDAARARKEQAEMAKLRDKQVSDFESGISGKFKTYPWFAERVQQLVTERVRRPYKDVYEVTQDPQLAKKSIDEGMYEVMRIAERGNAIGEASKILKDQLSKDKYVDQKIANAYINDTLFPTDNPDDSDLENATAITSHPRIFNASAYLQDWSNKFKEQKVDIVGETYSSGLGLVRDKTTQTVKFVKGVNPDGSLIPGVSEETKDITLASNPNIGDRFLWDYVAKTRNLDERLDRKEIDQEFEKIRDNPPPEAIKYVRDKVEEGLLVSQKQETRFSSDRLGQFPSNASAAKGRAKTEDIIERDRIIQAVQTPFGAMGELDEARPETLQFAKQFIGGKFGGMPIEDVEVVKAGKKSAFDNTTKNYDRYVFKVTEGKVSGEANTTTREMDLTKGDYGFWNTLLNTTPGNKKIDIGDLTKQNETLKQGNGEFDNL